MGLGLICVEISMVVGGFVGEILGSGDKGFGVGGSGLKVAQNLLKGLILVGLAVVGRG